MYLVIRHVIEIEALFRFKSITFKWSMKKINKIFASFFILKIFWKEVTCKVCHYINLDIIDMLRFVLRLTFISFWNRLIKNFYQTFHEHVLLLFQSKLINFSDLKQTFISHNKGVFILHMTWIVTATFSRTLANLFEIFIGNCKSLVSFLPCPNVQRHFLSLSLMRFKLFMKDFCMSEETLPQANFLQNSNWFRYRWFFLSSFFHLL